MSSEIIFDSPYATLWYHPESNIIHHKFHKSIYGQDYRDFFLLGTQTLKEHGAQKWLSDDQGNSLAGNEELQWGKEVWFPKTIEAGWKYWAIVQNKNTLGQVITEKLVKEFGSHGIETRYFTDINEAMLWLESL
jgi:hypothetical protein